MAVLGGPVKCPLAPSADEAVLRLKCLLSLLLPDDSPTPPATQAPSGTCARLDIRPWFPSRSRCQGRSVRGPQPGSPRHLRNPCSLSGPRGRASEPRLRAERGRSPGSFSFLACPRVPVNRSADPESIACLLQEAQGAHTVLGLPNGLWRGSVAWRPGVSSGPGQESPQSSTCGPRALAE